MDITIAYIMETYFICISRLFSYQKQKDQNEN